ncbi:MAG TPA: D-glycero-beta-D-manno-heptose 1-phosphate adenylyltransferase [Bacteroidia bacterium]|nr:D-glycero-beta-D-manno-heptose 1-phosphate adenylyltransferase [Bacteroidia bacterium]HNP99129.1 D-glycero-beta-D-manno-heptose 1-phosphate adenylyltransferase [Bacteroidia bacterium]
MTTLEIIQRKIYDIPSLNHFLSVHRFFNRKIVFTNGCFDILHLGHIDYLSKAADLGDVLIVGVNTDASTSRLKGKHRPINSQDQRSMLLASLHFVDGVVLFDEDTPQELIKAVRPSILVKGSDYSPETIVGADFVKSYGGKVQTIDFLPGFSTSSIEERIRAGKNNS